MSILATFIAVDPQLLDRLRDDPLLAERLFGPGTAPGAGFDTEQMRALIMSRGPQLLSGAMDMHPQLRSQLEQRLGHTQDALSRGQGGEALLRLMQDRLGVRRPHMVDGRHAELSLDKAWHGLHYILTGEPEEAAGPLAQAVLGGVEMGEDFAGYGPARALDPALVAGVARALDAPGLEQEASARYDPSRMNELAIYPFGWDASGLDWLRSALADVRGFYRDAAAHGRAAVTCLV
jgi:Domain of unknown function (DUF1877)